MLRQKLRNTLGIVGLVLGFGGWMECRSSSPPAVSAEVQVDEQQEYRKALLRRLVWSVADISGQIQNGGYRGKQGTEEERCQEERTALQQELKEILADRDVEIDALADEIYHREECSDASSDKKRPFTRQEMLRRIQDDADSIYLTTEHIPDISGFHFYNVPRLREELEKLQGPLEYKSPYLPDNQGTLAHTLADARRYERCLGEEGVVDMYVDVEQESEAGNCEQARNLLRTIGDRYGYFEKERYCTPLEYEDLDLDTQRELTEERFYGEVFPTLSDEDIVDTAKAISRYEGQQWQEACIAVRNNRGYSQNQAAAFCLADWIIQATINTESAFNVQQPPERLRKLARDLPSDQVERHCALKITAKNLDDYKESRRRLESGDYSEYPIYDPDKAYEKCVGS